MLLTTSIRLTAGVVRARDKLLNEKEHRTSVRISLIRAEYERQLGDLREKSKLACEQTVHEVITQFLSPNLSTRFATEREKTRLVVFDAVY